MKLIHILGTGCAKCEKLKHNAEEAEFTQFEHLRVTDVDMEKGKTPATPECVDKVTDRGRILLATQRGET